MKCIACGREMLDRGTHYECSNILCDYEEDIENKDVWVELKLVLPGILVNNSTKSFSSNCQERR
jgi:hypothetical protein